MEKAILKTLIYADIFDYPFKAYEIHKWLIGRRASLRQVEKAVNKLIKKRKLGYQKGYYFLPKQSSLVAKRKDKFKQSNKYLRKIHFFAPFLQLISWVKLVGVSGGLAMENASKADDIDLFIITAKNRLWISRLLILGLLSLFRQRRKPGEKGKKISGKFCLNILLEEDRLAQYKRDIYLAHEILQMRLVWQKEGIYSKYLEDNDWVFKFLPNWIGQAHFQDKVKVSSGSLLGGVATLLENVAKRFQLMIMKEPQGLERIEDGALYFHPQDYRDKVLTEYQKRIKKLSRT